MPFELRINSLPSVEVDFTRFNLIRGGSAEGGTVYQCNHSNVMHTVRDGILTITTGNDTLQLNWIRTAHESIPIPGGSNFQQITRQGDPVYFCEDVIESLPTETP